MARKTGTPETKAVEAADCLICQSCALRHFLRINERDYWRCDACGATFLDSRHWLNAEDERAQYMLHENRAEDPGYRKFLGRLANPLCDALKPSQMGLDYGCGPIPVLAMMLEEAGHTMAHYDPFFHDDPRPLERCYDFVTASETVEHFYHPAQEFERLDEILKPGGCLAIMTCFQTDDARFADWHYRRDLTHVVFYAERTFEVIAAIHGWSCRFPTKDIVLMQKPDSTDKTI